MSGFLYFLPGRGKNRVDTVAQAAEAGLPWIAETDGQIQGREILGSGPDGNPGLLIYDSEIVKTSRAKFLTGSDQQWRKMQSVFTGGAEIWVGYYQSDPPDLSKYGRSDAVPGELYRLENGQTIELPRARQFFDFDPEERVMLWRVALPTSLDIDDEGRETVGDVTAKYARLWRLAMQYQEALLAVYQGGDAEAIAAAKWPKRDEIQLVHEILMANYRFGLGELTALGLYSGELRAQALATLLDESGASVIQKKMLATLDTGDTSPGEKELTPASEDEAAA